MSPSSSASTRSKLVAATMIVALVAVVVTALVALGSLRGVDARAARGALGGQAETISEARPLVRLALIDSLSEVEGQLVALVPARGPTVGSGASLVPARVVAQVRSGKPASTVVRDNGNAYLVEARPTADGGGVVLMQDASTVRALTPELAVRIVVALAVGLGVAAIAAVLVARSLTRPLSALAERALRLARGERGMAFPASGVLEIDRIDQALAAIDAALLRSEGRQREFLLSISHEIRTPLTTLRGYAEALADGVAAPGEHREIGGILIQEVDRLVDFTEDLLALARLEADDFALDVIDDVDVQQILVATAQAWRAKAEVLGVTVVALSAPTVGTIVTDPRRVRQLLDGLVDNALRVSPRGGEIRLRATEVPAGGIAIEVSDDGPGLTADDASRAFDRGVLRDRYEASRPVGTGLGLSIAARLVDRLGGTIRAVPGAAGATFRIDLPGGVPNPAPRATAQ